MKTRPTLTTEAGAPVVDDRRSQTAGPNGPTLLQDHHLLEKLARFNRERIPERVVHAVGSGAHGWFEVTNPELPRWTRMDMLAERGRRTPLFLRFSTVAGSRGASDSVRDPRGFAVKFYTREGNWDVVGNNTPIFFLRDGIKFPDFIHSQKVDPFTNRQEPDNAWAFFAQTPEATHQMLWLYGDRGLPASYRHMDGFGSHTFQWVNAGGERFWVKLHFKTDQGIRTIDAAESTRRSGLDPAWAQHDPTTRSSRSGASSSTAAPTTTSPRSSSRPSIRPTSCPASAPRRTRCSRPASSPTATPSATGSASTTPGCR
jgi:catalase